MITATMGYNAQSTITLESIMNVINSPSYKSYDNMRQRCLNKNNKDYPSYGGRGIKICDSWLESFKNFIKDMGEKPEKGMSIERVDNEKDYSPDNCVWATPKEQGKNKRNNVHVPVDGRMVVLAEAARITGVPETSIQRYIKNGTWENGAHSRKRNLLHEVNGEKRTLIEWAAITGLKYGTLKYRHRKGLPIIKESEYDFSQ